MKTRRNLPLQYALQLKTTENWLILGELEEAVSEWKKLPQHVRLHPEARSVREKLSSFWRSLVSFAA